MYTHPPPPPPPPQITDVGPLSSGTSIITFYILNGTDPEAPPTFVSAAMVMAAIQSRNLSQILTYPVSNGVKEHMHKYCLPGLRVWLRMRKNCLVYVSG